VKIFLPITPWISSLKNPAVLKSKTTTGSGLGSMYSQTRQPTKANKLIIRYNSQTPFVS
jgi:hypothetical protein